MPMSRTLLSWLSFSALLVSAFAGDFEFSNCDCDGEGFWSSERILQAQKVSDCLIATAYFSIPLELLYFVSCSHVFPFKWILFQFVAFIVLCGLSHLLTVFTYKAHSFLLMLSLTVSKFLTALVSFATAITLLTLIPQLLRVKVRENFLRIKAQDLDRRVEMMKREEEASWQVRVLTQEIRRSLDRQVILFTTVVELSKILGLQNCAVWMPNEDQAEMNLTHEVEQRSPREADGLTIPMDDPDVVEITKNSSTMLLSQDSLLGFASSGHGHERGAAVAIRMPLLKASDFKGGTAAAAAAAAETSYAILVLVLREDAPQEWGASELGIVEVVADQVAVALLHAGVLEESQRMREKLEEQNQALQQARMDAMMANKARNSFHNVTSHGMRRPVHSILGLLSMFQQETLSSEQRLVINTMMKMSSVTSALIGDITESPDSGVRSLVLETKPFHLHTTIKEAAAIVRFLCDSRGFGFGVQIDNDIPNLVYGDEKRVFQVILHTAGDLLNQRDGGFLRFSVLSESGIDGKQGQKWVPWKASVPDGHAGVRFEIGIKGAQSDGPSSSDQRLPRSSGGGGRLETRQKFGMCKKLVQMMQGDVWVVSNGQGLADSTILLLRLRHRRSGESSDHGGAALLRAPSGSLFKGLRVLLADGDDVNRAVTQKLLEKLGCRVTSVSTGFQCLNLLGGAAASSPFDLVLLDVLLRDMDGFHLTARIHKLRSSSWSPLIVALTASSQEALWERCVHSGMHGLIQKPVMLQAMADELCRVLRIT